MSTIAMFTKHDGDPQQTLFDLQCIWYELEVGESYARRGSDGLALKKFYAVEKHFTDFVEDQFDFHAFSIRKVFEHCHILPSFLTCFPRQPSEPIWMSLTTQILSSPTNSFNALDKMF